MLDFVINLLIFFIITAVFVKESGLTVNRPTSFETPPENKETRSIQIQILDNGEVWVDNRAVDVRAVRANVERLNAVNPDGGVLIIAAGERADRHCSCRWSTRCTSAASTTSRSRRRSEPQRKRLNHAITRHTPETGETRHRPRADARLLLNLLIFFIITTSFIKEAGVTVFKPGATTAEHEDSGNMLIAIRENGDIWMDRQQVDLRDVRPLIERLHIERPDDTVVIIADKASKAGIVAKVMDEVRLAGVKYQSIAADPNVGAG